MSRGLTLIFVPRREVLTLSASKQFTFKTVVVRVLIIQGTLVQVLIVSEVNIRLVVVMANMV